MTSLSLLLEAKRFQCLGLRFGLSKELLRGRSLCPGVGPREGVSRTREKRRWFYLWSTLLVLRWLHPAALPAVPVWPGAGSPKRALAGRCFEHHGGGGRLPPAWQLPEKSGWAAWLCLPPSRLPTEGLTPLLRPLSSLGGMGWIHHPVLFGRAAASRTTGARPCPRWVLANPHCHRAKELYTVCWNHWRWRCFYADINQWDNEGISHLHAF